MDAANGQPANARTAKPRRPIGVSVLIALGTIKAVLMLTAAVAFYVGRDDATLLVELDSTERGMVGTALAIGVLGAVNLVLAIGLFRGSRSIRWLFGIIATVEAGAAVFALVGLRDVRLESVWALVFPVAVLWFLYGSQRTQAYFER